MVVESEFRPPIWLRNPHVQTVWGALIRRIPQFPLRWEVVELPDGDFVELSWLERDHDRDTPTAVVLHGLGGSVDSHYVRGLMAALDAEGWRVACLHFRGCGRGPNRHDTGYHSGQSEDPRHVLGVLRERWPEATLAAVGFSLGANVLLKMLGEDGEHASVDRAAAISAPLVLARCADRMERGASRMYQRRLLRNLRTYVRSKPSPFGPEILDGVRTFRDFDDRITAPLHGFRDSADYYERASCRPFLRTIRRPTLVVHAADDPFFVPEVVPTDAELSEDVLFELAAHGGHVGFVGGWGQYHVDTRVPRFLAGDG